MSDSSKVDSRFHFKPASHSWVAIHPNPKGVIQFVGSFFIFGSLPTVFYNSLLRNLYNQQYTIIAYPSSVIPPLRWKSRLVDHWQASVQLLKEEYAIKAEIITYLLDYTDRETINIYLNQSNSFWLGHSLGCKYISILEILSSDTSSINSNLEKCGFTPQELQLVAADIEELESSRTNSELRINNLLKRKDIEQKLSTKRGIVDQPSVFLAPEIYGTQNKTGSKIPYFDIFPNGEKTLCLINKSRDFFNLIALIGFRQDNISYDDIQGLKQEFSSRSINLNDKLILKNFQGYDLKIEMLSSILSHLKPASGNAKSLAACIDKIFEELRTRTLAAYMPQQVQCKTIN